MDEPNNFWIYNNGITILTNGIHIDGNNISLSGFSIINGAQTTGSLAEAATQRPLRDAQVLFRAIKCNDTGLIDTVIRYNNTQNPIKAWELRVIDPIQRRLQGQFSEIGISYQLRRSVARRRANDVLFEKLAPSLSAFYGDPFSAHRNRPELFESERRYRQLFSDESKVRNLLFIYRLGDAVAYAKSRLRDRIVSHGATHEEQGQYDLFRYGAFSYVLIHICAEVLGILLNAERGDFKKYITMTDEIFLDQERCIEVLGQLALACLKLARSHLDGKNAYEVIRSQPGVEELTRQGKTIVSQVQGMVPETYVAITQHLRVEPPESAG